MSREPIPTHFFVLVVVQEQRLNGPNRYLLVHELKHGGGWYLPAGRVEPGETFADAARRETLEETGLSVSLTGFLRIEHTALEYSSRLRMVFLAQPVDGTPPRTVPNEHTLGAAWYSLEELDQVYLRGPDVRTLLERVENGAAPCSIELIGDELEYL